MNLVVLLLLFLAFLYLISVNEVFLAIVLAILGIVLILFPKGVQEEIKLVSEAKGSYPDKEIFLEAAHNLNKHLMNIGTPKQRYGEKSNLTELMPDNINYFFKQLRKLFK